MALHDYENSPLYTEPERAALAWADAMTLSHLDTTDALFTRLKNCYSDDEIVELTAAIAFENFRSKFNNAFRVPSLGFWQPQTSQKTAQNDPGDTGDR